MKTPHLAADDRTEHGRQVKNYFLTRTCQLGQKKKTSQHFQRNIFQTCSFTAQITEDNAMDIRCNKITMHF